MKIFLTKDIRELDDRTIEDQGIKSLELMERASREVANYIIKHKSAKYPVVIFAGPGNNGGDALAVARMLTLAGYQTSTYLFNIKESLSPECDANRIALINTPGAGFFEVIKEFSPPDLNKDTLVIDGIFGSGLNSPVKGGFGEVIKYINTSGAEIISIDVPSGYFGEDNTDNFPVRIIKATETLSFQFPKLSFMFPESEKFTGKVILLDINISQKAISEHKTHIYYTEAHEVARIIKKRAKFSHKGNFGEALLVAGSFGMMGAAVISAKACMRSGAGLLTVHTAECGYTILQSCAPEAKFSSDKNKTHITSIPDVTKYNAVGIGPGIGMDSNTAYAFRHLLNSGTLQQKPLVIDADALNLIAKENDLLNKLPGGTILTPHPKEFDRLFGECENGFKRYRRARDMAMRYNVIIVLKGANSAVVLPTGDVYFNSSGNPGMATAGSGDVLTGIILALLAQGYKPEKAAVLGTFIHGMAGDIAAQNNSQEALIASDIIENIGKSFCKLRDL